MENKIRECAIEILGNTKSLEMKERLENFLNKNDQYTDLYKVIKAIAEDGYYIAGFGLVEIINQKTYYFRNNHECFDVFLGKDAVTIGFTVTVDEIDYKFITNNIAEAIRNYDLY